jgi:hypothetical protein
MATYDLESTSNIFGLENKQSPPQKGKVSPKKNSSGRKAVRENDPFFANTMKQESMRSFIFTEGDLDDIGHAKSTPHKRLDLVDHEKEDVRRKQHMYSDIFAQNPGVYQPIDPAKKPKSKLTTKMDWKDTKTEDKNKPKSVDVCTIVNFLRDVKEMFNGSPENPLHEEKKDPRNAKDVKKYLKQDREWQKKSA